MTRFFFPNFKHSETPLKKRNDQKSIRGALKNEKLFYRQKKKKGRGKITAGFQLNHFLRDGSTGFNFFPRVIISKRVRSFMQLMEQRGKRELQPFSLIFLSSVIYLPLYFFLSFTRHKEKYCGIYVRRTFSSRPLAFFVDLSDQEIFFPAHRF